MRRCLLLALLAVLAGAAPAHAYKLGGKSWPKRTITYHVAIPQYEAAIAEAAAAWNASGADIRLKEVVGPARGAADRGRRPGRPLGRGLARLRQPAEPVLHDGRGHPDQRRRPLWRPRAGPREGPAPGEVRLWRPDGAAPGRPQGPRRSVDAQRDGDRGRPRVRARARPPPREEHVRGDELPARAGLPEAGRPVAEAVPAARGR